MPTTFKTAPPALGLPTASPHGLAMMVALRFAHEECDTKYVAGMTKPVVTVTGDDAVVVSAASVQSVAALLQRNRRGLDDSLSDVLRGESASVEAIAEAFVFPAFSFVVAADANLRQATAAGGLSSLLSSFWPASTSAASFQTVAAALDAAEKGLMSLDRLLCAKGARIVDVNGTDGQPATTMYAATPTGPQLFILGTSYPTSADCFAYAAASVFLHGDLGSRCRDPVVLKWQIKARQQFALLLNYVEGIRRRYFEDYAGTYALKAIPALDDVNAENAVYKEGRWKTVVATAVFASLYFVIVNANLILTLLGGEDVEEGSEPPAAATEVAEPRPPAPAVPPAGQPTSPK